MRIFLLISLTMVAFAANSILTRLAIAGGHMDPSGFALIRVLSGAVVLGMLMTLRGGALRLLRKKRLPGAFSLAAYMVGFSLAYLTLDAGLGALILFGVVQIAMFVHAATTGMRPSLRQVSGAGLAFAGLLIALWPGAGGNTDVVGAALMVVAGLGWAAYSIIGRGAVDPLAATTANFLLCLPILIVLLVGPALSLTITGAALAILCGGLTSGLGYALWYRVLPQIEGATAAVVQLSVPILAILGGALLLNETVGVLLMVAAAMVVGGIGWTVTAPKVPVDHR
ncbi:DMT family transporter [Sulfitobacter mediterraneus]|nr:DMT family transporter [Sulfitobacter mediterraneus]